MSNELNLDQMKESHIKLPSNQRSQLSSGRESSLRTISTKWTIAIRFLTNLFKPFASAWYRLGYWTIEPKGIKSLSKPSEIIETTSSASSLNAISNESELTGRPDPESVSAITDRPEPRFIIYLKTLPRCPKEGWPRYCSCYDRVEWFAHNEIFGAISVETLANADAAGLDPEEVVKRFIDEVRATAH